MINGNYFILFVALPILVVCIHPILNIQGVEINTKKQVVRAYKLKIFGKTGDWHDLKLFQSISVDNETYNIHYALPDDIPIISERYSHFVVSLVHNSNEGKIILAEISDYHEAQDFARKLASALDIAYIDVYAKRLLAAKLKKRR